MADNGIEVIENLDENTELTTLELANNRISSLSGLEKLINVDDFWFNDNKVSFKVHYFRYVLTMNECKNTILGKIGFLPLSIYFSTLIFTWPGSI